MNRTTLGLLAVAALVSSLNAHAQLKSVDNGAAAIDNSGLMWANTVGIDLGWSTSSMFTGTAQSWIVGLNASDYGGHNDWTLATGDGSLPANRTTNQLGQLFYADCGNSIGTSTTLTHAGKSCTALSALNSVISTPSIFFSSSVDTAASSPSDTVFWAYKTPDSRQQGWTNDTAFDTGGLPLVGLGDALAVRAAPEIDPASAGSGIALLFGSLAVLRGRRAKLRTQLRDRA
jgi:hypothetical protein